MRKKPNSPYTELMEANKRILQEDGKYLDYSNIPVPYTQSFQQLTFFKIPQYFENTHSKNQKKTEIHVEQNQPTVKQSDQAIEPIIRSRSQGKLIKRQQFSMSRFQMAQLESNQISAGSFKRSNYTLNKILSSLPIEQLNQIHQAKQQNIQLLTSKRKQRQLRQLTPKYNLKSDSLMAQVFGSSNIFPTIRLKTMQ